MTSPVTSPSKLESNDTGRRSTPAVQSRSPIQPTAFVFGDKDSSRKNERITNPVEADAQTQHSINLLAHLSTDLSNLLNRTDISDCYLNVRGTFMAVHKCILAARSNAFAAVISGTINRLESNVRSQIEAIKQDDKLIIMINKTDPEIMKQVVIFMYTAKCDLDEGNAYALLDAAGRYDIKDLKVHTGRYLANHINTNNILMLLKAAYRYDNKLIKQRCIEYFLAHAKEIMAIHELWKKFAEEQQAIVAELLHWLVNKELFYNEKPQWDAASLWD